MAKVREAIKADLARGSIIPWEEKPSHERSVIWRYSANPIIAQNHIPTSNSIFNSAVVFYQGAFAGVFRCDDKARRMQIHTGRSLNGIDWDLDPDPIQWQTEDRRVLETNGHFEYSYDPRVVRIEDRYYITWCNGFHGPTIGLGYTLDFQDFYQMENAFLPFNRNGVLFPERISGKYAMLSRPSDNGHTPFGDIYYSESPDLVHWGRHRYVMGATDGWQSTKIGAGPVPIKTPEGWLLIYHGVLTSCNGFVYSFGAALLDLEQPWKVIARGRDYLLAPQEPYERVGDVPNVVFPCAALTEPESGKIAIYYGAADTVVGLAFGYIDEIIRHIKRNSHP